MKIANWYENCKLIWKLQSSSHISVYSSYLDVCNFHMRHGGNEHLFWNRKNVLVRLRCGWQKHNETIISRKTFHNSYFNPNSYADTFWFILKDIIPLLSRRFRQVSALSEVLSEVLLNSTVRLTSIYNPQIEGKFTETSGGSTNLFYGCKD